MTRPPRRSTLSPYTPLSRSAGHTRRAGRQARRGGRRVNISEIFIRRPIATSLLALAILLAGSVAYWFLPVAPRSEEHTSELQSHLNLVCRLLLEKKKNITSSVNRRERSGINTILHELNPLFTINVTMRDIKRKNVYSRVNSKATTQWRKTESANCFHLEGVASDNRSSFFFYKTTTPTNTYALPRKGVLHT